MSAIPLSFVIASLSLSQVDISRPIWLGVSLLAAGFFNP